MQNLFGVEKSERKREGDKKIAFSERESNAKSFNVRCVPSEMRVDTTTAFKSEKGMPSQ